MEQFLHVQNRLHMKKRYIGGPAYKLECLQYLCTIINAGLAEHWAT